MGQSVEWPTADCEPTFVPTVGRYILFNHELHFLSGFKDSIFFLTVLKHKLKAPEVIRDQEIRD